MLGQQSLEVGQALGLILEREGFRGVKISEAAFLEALVERTGCGLLLDLNNLHDDATGVRALCQVAED